MFEIEFVTARDAGEPQVVETVTSNFVQLAEADKIAKSLLEKARHEPRGMSPNGYLIRAADGRVVLRFWDTGAPQPAPLKMSRHGTRSEQRTRIADRGS